MQDINRTTIEQKNSKERGMASLLIVLLVILLIVGGAGYFILNSKYSGLNFPSPSPIDNTHFTTAPKSLPTPDYLQQKVTDNAQISIQKNSFTPSVLQIKKDSTVTWVNNDTNAHQLIVVGVFTITKDTPDANLTTDPIDPSGQVRFTFTKGGAFSYYFKDSPSLKGTVNVVE